MLREISWLTILPSLNACLNATSAACLAVGYVAIRRRRIALHRGCMLGALAASSLFLAGYLTRVYLTGTHRFWGQGLIKYCYLALLGSHMLLAIVLLPMVLRTLFFAGKARFAEHQRIARFTWPTWMYVSVTGVLVYWLLYRLAPTTLPAM